MQWLDKEMLRRSRLNGTFLNLASATSVEIAAATGFDWLLLDFEHGSGSFSQLRPLLHACRGASAAPIVRIRSVDADIVKFVMDSGAAGVMFPYVSTPAEAQQAVQHIKYPPQGNRGVAGIIRATDYGRNWKSYFTEANANSLVVVQIETPQAVESASEIAATEGVDVLFVGPLDLSANMGHPGDFSPPSFEAALRSVVEACEHHGKSAGILSKPGFVDQHKAMGFRLFALGSDSGAVAGGLHDYLQAMR
jgi:4-hydroxy-2-oxoheptanedioate aldolase